MESVRKAKERFRQYPIVLGKCSKQATIYATCVLKRDNLSLNDCKEEFVKFKDCLQQVASRLNTRL